jgi:hypothetical protein
MSTAECTWGEPGFGKCSGNSSGRRFNFDDYLAQGEGGGQVQVNSWPPFVVGIAMVLLGFMTPYKFPPQRIKDETARRIVGLLRNGLMILAGIALMYKGAFG